MGLAHRESDRLAGTIHTPRVKRVLNCDFLYWRSFLPVTAPSCYVRAGNASGGGDWAVDRLVPDFSGWLAQVKRYKLVLLILFDPMAMYRSHYLVI